MREGWRRGEHRPVTRGHDEPTACVACVACGAAVCITPNPGGHDEPAVCAVLAADGVTACVASGVEPGIGPDARGRDKAMACMGGGAAASIGANPGSRNDAAARATPTLKVDSPQTPNCAQNVPLYDS